MLQNKKTYVVYIRPNTSCEARIILLNKNDSSGNGYDNWVRIFAFLHEREKSLLIDYQVLSGVSKKLDNHLKHVIEFYN